MQGSPHVVQKKTCESLGVEEKQMQRPWGRNRFGIGGVGRESKKAKAARQKLVSRSSEIWMGVFARHGMKSL